MEPDSSGSTTSRLPEGSSTPSIIFASTAPPDGECLGSNLRHVGVDTRALSKLTERVALGCPRRSSPSNTVPPAEVKCSWKLALCRMVGMFVDSITVPLASGSDKIAEGEEIGATSKSVDLLSAGIRPAKCSASLPSSGIVACIARVSIGVPRMTSPGASKEIDRSLRQH